VSDVDAPKPGWRRLVGELGERLEAIAGGSTRLVGAREKFGRLQIDIAGDKTPNVQVAVAAAEEASTRTCDVCGAPGVLTERGPVGWISVRCPVHDHWTRLDEIRGDSRRPSSSKEG
jgi:hypothetical protein